MRRAVIAKLAREVARFARWRLCWTLALIVALPLTEGLGLALLLPTLQSAGLDLALQGQSGRLVAIVWRLLAAFRLRPGLLGLLAIFVVLAAIRAAMERARGVSIWTLQQRFIDDQRRRLYRAIAGAQWRFLSRSRMADFIHALTAELGRVNEAVSSSLLLAGEVALGFLYIALAVLLSPAMTAMVLGAGGLLMLALRDRTRRIERHGAELAQITNLLYAAATEHLQSLKTARTYGAEERNFELFSRVSARIAATNIETAREQVVASSWFELGAALLLMPILYVAVRIIKVPPAELLLLLLMFIRLMPRMQSAHFNYRNVVNALPSFANLTAMTDRCRAAVEPAAAASEPSPFRREIRLECVSFSYDPGAPPALRSVDLSIAVGAITAIVGPSGAGKSTIADLVMGLSVPDSGTLSIDGVALDPGAARAWRGRIGYVAHETALFHLSVRDNLLWARPDASEGELREALRLAAADFVSALPNGIDTVVGDRGALLSQGECQRIALARALLRRPVLLILDEATNGLDYENEARVLGAIEAIGGGLSVLLIAHRLSAIRYADLIYVVEDGTVVESGGWDELIGRRGGRFKALCETHRLVA